MSKNEKITISLIEYRRLIAAELELDALIEYGVDNWSGYGDHSDFYNGNWPEFCTAYEIDYDAIVDSVVNNQIEKKQAEKAAPTLSLPKATSYAVQEPADKFFELNGKYINLDLIKNLSFHEGDEYVVDAGIEGEYYATDPSIIYVDGENVFESRSIEYAKKTFNALFDAAKKRG